MNESRLDWLGIVALLLSVPLGVLANILTPKADVVDAMGDFDSWASKIKEEINALRDRYDLRSDSSADPEQPT